MDNQTNRYDNGGGYNDGNRGNMPVGNNGNNGNGGREPQRPSVLMWILWGISLLVFVALVWNLFS